MEIDLRLLWGTINEEVVTDNPIGGIQTPTITPVGEALIFKNTAILDQNSSKRRAYIDRAKTKIVAPFVCQMAYKSDLKRK